MLALAVSITRPSEANNVMMLLLLFYVGLASADDPMNFTMLYMSSAQGGGMRFSNAKVVPKYMVRMETSQQDCARLCWVSLECAGFYYENASHPYCALMEVLGAPEPATVNSVSFSKVHSQNFKLS
jgi:hypothetical protein